jgi:aminopeptidase-like protein
VHLTAFEPDSDCIASAPAEGQRMHALLTELYPICRSLTGPGLRMTLRRLADEVPLQIAEIPSGTPVFDWIVPDEWTIEDAYVEDDAGRRIVDFRAHTLHVVSYSRPVDRWVSLDELRPHLHSLPDRPDWIPYRTTYYADDWGFCLPHRVYEQLQPGRYHAVVRSRLAPGSMSLAEYVHHGESEDEVLVFAHTCHPSLANDNLSGIVVAIRLAAWLQRRPTRYTYRFVFAPATIGSIAWLALHSTELHRIRHGLVLSLLGDRGNLNYKRSRGGNAMIDRAAIHVLHHYHPGGRVIDFSPWGYDERQFGSPGIALPVGRLTRTPNGEFPEYHTSADNPGFVTAEALGESWLACLRIIGVLENEVRYRNLKPYGEPQLGRRGLYRSTGGFQDIPDRQLAMLWLLNQSDGSNDLLAIAERSGLPFYTLRTVADELVRANLLAPEGLPA